MVRLAQLSTTQKVALMVSLPATGILLYFLMRSLMEDEDEEVERTRTVSSRQTVIEVKVPRDAVGAVIGSGGAQIKQIQETSGARVNFKDEHGECSERLVVIRGSHESAQHAELMIRKIIADQPEIISQVIYVPRKAVGRIIGRSGDNIRLMTRSSRARIIVDRSDEIGPNNTKKVTIKGFPLAVANAKSLIEDAVNEEEIHQAKMAVAASNRQVRHHRAADHEEAGQKGSTVPGAALSTGSAGVEQWPTHGEFMEVYISAVEHPGHFWVQLLTCKSTQLDTLVAEMTTYYSHPEFTQARHADSLTEGDIVAVTYPGDHQWYRARVCGFQDGKVDVYYVDFGDNSLVSRDAVMTLRSDFLTLPLQAMECRLAHVQPSGGGEWSEEAIERFEELVHVAKWKVVMARATGYTHHHDLHMTSLELVDTSTTTDVNVGEELLRGGYAEPDSTSLDRPSEVTQLHQTSVSPMFESIQHGAEH